MLELRVEAPWPRHLKRAGRHWSRKTFSPAHASVPTKVAFPLSLPFLLPERRLSSSCASPTSASLARPSLPSRMLFDFICQWEKLFRLSFLHGWYHSLQPQVLCLASVLQSSARWQPNPVAHIPMDHAIRVQEVDSPAQRGVVECRGTSGWSGRLIHQGAWPGSIMHAFMRRPLLAGKLHGHLMRGRAPGHAAACQPAHCPPQLMGAPHNVQRDLLAPPPPLQLVAGRSPAQRAAQVATLYRRVHAQIC